MKQKLFYILMMLIFSGFESIAQAEKPSINNWHRTEPNAMAFSHNGDYLITLDDDKTGIITDISKRISISRIDEIEETFLEVHPNKASFYTINIKEDTVNVQNRKLPSGTIEETISLPGSITVGEQSYRIDEFFQLVKIDFMSENIYAIYDNQVVRFSLKDPKDFQIIHGISAAQINALIIDKGMVYVATPDQIYKQENDVMKPIVTLQNQSDDYFSNIEFDNDRLVALSNKYVRWYDQNSFSEIKKASIDEFGYDVMTKGHPFEVAKNSDILLVNWSSPDRGELEMNKPYSLATIGGSTVYSIKSDKTTTLDLVPVGKNFAYNSLRNIVALQNSGSIDIASVPQGFLFSVGSGNIPLNALHFTSKPGEILLTTGQSHDELAYLVDIGTTKLEPMGVVESDLYTKYPSQYEHFKPNGKPVEIFNYSNNEYSTIPVLYADNEKHVLLPVLSLN